MSVRFHCRKKFRFRAGQFLSVLVPTGRGSGGSQPAFVKRAYSFSSAPEEAHEGIYELCVKLMPGGLGSTYLSRMKEGEEFTVFGPYGDFGYDLAEGRDLCLVATGSGLGPFRSIALSREFRERPPARATLLFGARNEKDILYPAEFFERVGIRTIIALSQPGPDWKGYRGRVTDFLREQSQGWNWHHSDFYLCGNGDMAADVADFLRLGHGVAPSAIHQEVLFARTQPVAAPGQSAIITRAAA